MYRAWETNWNEHSPTTPAHRPKNASRRISLQYANSTRITLFLQNKRSLAASRYRWREEGIRTRKHGRQNPWNALGANERCGWPGTWGKDKCCVLRMTLITQNLCGFDFWTMKSVALHATTSTRCYYAKHTGRLMQRRVLFWSSFWGSFARPKGGDAEAVLVIFEYSSSKLDFTWILKLISATFPPFIAFHFEAFPSK